MNMKKILITFLVLMAIGSTMTAISAEVTSTSNSVTIVNNELTINDIKFTIPDGFEEVTDDTNSSESDDDDDDDNETEQEDIDGTVVDTTASSEFKNSAGEKLEVTVGSLANDKKIESISPKNSEEKTIGDKEGYLIKEDKDGKTEFKFEFLENGKLVKITAPSEDVINQVLTTK